MALKIVSITEWSKPFEISEGNVGEKEVLQNLEDKITKIVGALGKVCSVSVVELEKN